MGTVARLHKSTVHGCMHAAAAWWYICTWEHVAEWAYACNRIVYCGNPCYCTLTCTIACTIIRRQFFRQVVLPCRYTLHHPYICPCFWRKHFYTPIMVCCVLHGWSEDHTAKGTAHCGNQVTRILGVMVTSYFNSA